MAEEFSSVALAQRLVESLPEGTDKLFNPYRQSSPDDAPGNTPEARLVRLAAHLDCSPRFVLVGEAPGYQGCRVSGVAFTSERLIIQGQIPRLQGTSHRLSLRSLRPRPWSEPSATIVWSLLHALGAAESTVLWNALQLHPRKPGEFRSNRKPSREERRGGIRSLQILRDAFPDATFVAIGDCAQEALSDARIAGAGKIRHPSFGGKPAFVQGLTALVG